MPRPSDSSVCSTLLVSALFFLPSAGVQEAKSKPKGQVAEGPATALWPVPDKYAKRRHGRSKLDNKKAATAIANALSWLASHQDKDGKWDCDEFMKHDTNGTRNDGPGYWHYDVAVTGLAVLCFLAEGNTSINGTYRQHVQRGLRWLSSQQDRKGRFSPTIYSDSFIYQHSIATIAMTEGYGLSGNPNFKRSAAAGIRYLETHRRDNAAWRYKPRRKISDSSITGWALTACITARDFGLPVKPELFAEVDDWFVRVTDKDSGATGYTEAGTGSARETDRKKLFPAHKSESLTAIALFARLSLGHALEEESLLKKQTRRLLGRLPSWDEDDGSIDLYYWFYGSLAMRQLGMDYWSHWSEALWEALLPAQRRVGKYRGSWDPISVWSRNGGRIYSTAMATLCLQAAYRYADISEICPFPRLPRFALARSYWQEKRFDRVSTFLAKMDESKLSADEMTIFAKGKRDLERRTEAAIDYIHDIRYDSDHYAAKLVLEEMKKNFVRLPPGNAAVKKLASFRKDKRIMKEIRAGVELEKLEKRYANATDVKELSKIRSRLKTFLRRFKYSFASEEGKALLEELLQKLKKK